MNVQVAAANKRVVLAKIGRVHGIKGWLKLNSFTSPPANILTYAELHTKVDNAPRLLQIDDSREQQKGLIVHFQGFDDPETASILTGCEIWVPSIDMPALEAGSFYWHELQGLQVVNLQEQLFGSVQRLMETGANDGISDSTTLFFEKCLGWRGALIEPHPVFWTRLLRTPRAHSTKRQAAVCARNGTAVIERKPWMGSTIRTAGEEVGLEVPCAPLSELLGSVHALRHAGRVDVLSLDVEGHEPIAVSTLGSELSYGVVMAEVEVGPRRVDTMKTLLARGMHYAGQISARPSPANYVISDVWWNRSHFERFWPRSRVLSL